MAILMPLPGDMKCSTGGPALSVWSKAVILSPHSWREIHGIVRRRDNEAKQHQLLLFVFTSAKQKREAIPCRVRILPITDDIVDEGRNERQIRSAQEMASGTRNAPSAGKSTYPLLNNFNTVARKLIFRSIIL